MGSDITYQELLTAQPEMWKDSAEGWNKWSTAVHEHSNSLASITTTVAESWDGLASSEAHSFVTAAHVRAANSAAALRRVEACLKEAYATFARAHNALISLRDQAEGLGFEVRSDGTITDPHNVLSRVDGQRLNTLIKRKDQLQKAIRQVVAGAKAADEKVASTLNGLMPPRTTTLASAPNGGSPNPGTTYAPPAPVDYGHSPGDIPVPPNALSNAPNPRAKAVLDYALKQLGDPYVYGAAGPNAFDCSGLTSQAYHAAGIDIPRTADRQWAAGPRIPDGQEQPGDLVYFHMGSTGPGHVGIVLDPAKGTMIVAPHTGDHVKIESYKNYPGGYVGFTRPGVR
ncbi:C40 family peptidase [Actinoallomurus rhizosphaericola]|uniref:C40 family peptidase n=1 Tax=Actinoallomurus rhizosphaericola TaxID=2952536 RepID=UPI002091D347|nr:C40 family peptidase [Actinoallomurus rhizosphaericola]MCO5993123.1 NlpC/P60 family protein [Actinoallomurus rhizosphaericola]